MVDVHQYLNGSRDLITLLSGMICHPRLGLARSTCLPNLNLYLHALRIYEKGYKV